MRKTKLHEGDTPARNQVMDLLNLVASAAEQGQVTVGECVEYLEERYRSLTVKPTYPPPKD